MAKGPKNRQTRHFFRRLGTLVRGSNNGDQFTNAKPGTTAYKVYKNHMPNEDSFVNFDTGIKFIMEKKNYAYFEGSQYFPLFPEYISCQVNNIFFLAGVAMPINRLVPDNASMEGTYSELLFIIGFAEKFSLPPFHGQACVKNEIVWCFDQCFSEN